MRRQRTIERKTTIEGVGLHTGKKVRLTFLPAKPGTGRIFKRVDVSPRKPEIKAVIANCVQSERSTSIGLGRTKVHTVEHVLAALAGLNIDNVIIEMDAPEPPAMDGSAWPIVELLKDAGIREQEDEIEFVEIDHTVSYEVDDVSLVYVPYNGFKVSFTIAFDHSYLGAEFLTVDFSDDNGFSESVARARTFCFDYEIDELRKNGLIKGGDLSNGIVLAQNGPLNEEPLRYPDEFVRHKILDLIGDLALLGHPLKGHIIAVKSGHKSNVAFVRKLIEASGGIPAPPMITDKYYFNIKKIKKYIPHRYPFLLVDRVLSFEKNYKIIAMKNVSINEPFFQGHFPETSVVPGVLLIEAIAQTGALLLNLTDETDKSRLIYVLTIEKARFRRFVVPGDQLIMQVVMKKTKGQYCTIKGEAFVEGKLVADLEMLAVYEDPSEKPFNPEKLS